MASSERAPRNADQDRPVRSRLKRCGWAGTEDFYVRYHDEEWGVPVHDDQKLFEFLVLEGAQAGLSWATILKKREGYRRAFEGFDPERVAHYGPAEVHRLMQDPRRLWRRYLHCIPAFLWHIAFQFSGLRNYPSERS